MRHPSHIIIGAGLSGLACAYTLQDCLVLEQEATVGGLCRTVTYDGMRFDLGGHRLFTPNPEIEALFRTILKEDILTVPRRSKILWKNKYIDYPLKKSVMGQLTPWQAGLCLLTFFLRKIFPMEERSFSGRAANRFGDGLYRLFLEPYTRKVWGRPCEDLSPEWVNIRLQDVSLLRAIRCAFVHDPGIRSFADQFIYPKKGIVQLAERLAEGIPLRLHTKVTGLDIGKDRINRVQVNNAEWLECDRLVSTMPLPVLTGLCDPPASVRDAARHLEYRSLIFVFLILNKKQYSPQHWIYFPGQEIFGRIHEPKNWSADMADGDRTGLCCEIFCDPADRIWGLSDAEIAHQTIRDLPAVNRFDIVDHAVLREKYAYPVYTRDYKQSLRTVTDFLSRYKNLFILGRTGSFQYINMDACIEQGLALGRQLSRQPSMTREISCCP